MGFSRLIAGTWTFPQLIYLKSTINLHKYTIISPKTGKIRDILRWSSEFSDWTAFKKLSPPSGSKKLSSITQKSTNFSETGSSVYKIKNFKKTENFTGREFLTLTILFGGVSKFWVRIPPWNFSPGQGLIKSNLTLVSYEKKKNWTTVL